MKPDLPAQATTENSQPFETFPKKALKWNERWIVGFCNWVNRSTWFKWVVQTYVRIFPRNFVGWVSRSRLRTVGLEHVKACTPDKGVILVANHRSFFDMYIGACALYDHTSLIKRLYFPVRAPFFYTHFLGLVVNMVMSGCAMWPAVFRDERKRELNPIGFKQMLYALKEKGAVLGIHPEGTRNKGDDPYTFLPARPGLGRLVRAAPPETVVVVFFILGHSNSIGQEVKERLGKKRKRTPIDLHFAVPITCGSLQHLESDEAVTEALMVTLRTLAGEQRKKVAALDAPTES